MTRRTFSNPELQATFEADGYVRVPMLNADQVAALLDELGALTPSDEFAPDGNGLALNSYHCSFLDDDIGYKRAAFELLSRHFADVLDRYLSGYRVLTTNFYVKPPGQGDLRVHQNWPVLRDHNETSVTLWCPLIDVNVRNGTLHIAPASHKLVPHVEGPNSIAYFAPFLDTIYDHLIPLNASAGEGFIFDDSIVHGSPPNLSDGPRIAVQISCIPAEAAPVFFFSDGGPRFELIAADTDFYLSMMSRRYFRASRTGAGSGITKAAIAQSTRRNSCNCCRTAMRSANGGSPRRSNWSRRSSVRSRRSRRCPGTLHGCAGTCGAPLRQSSPTVLSPSSSGCSGGRGQPNANRSPHDAVRSVRAGALAHDRLPLGRCG